MTFVCSHFRRFGSFMLLIVLLGLLLVMPEYVDAANRRKPGNVVFLPADDLGWSDLECCGAGWHVPPRLNALASESLLFPRPYIAAPVSTIDLYPTILDLWEITGNPDHYEKIDGKRHSPLLEHPGETLSREARSWTIRIMTRRPRQSAPSVSVNGNCSSAIRFRVSDCKIRKTISRRAKIFPKRNPK